MTNEERASDLMRKYFLKLEKDIMKDIELKRAEALKEKDYPEVIRLQGEKDGAFAVIVAILQGSLFYGIPNPEESIKRYLKKNIHKKRS